MNPVEIDEAVSQLALAPFDRAEFAYQFLTAFGNKTTTIQRLRARATNQSDLPGGVLQRGHIHILACAPGAVDRALAALRDSPKTASQKARFILTTDGAAFLAEDMAGGGTIACSYAGFPDHFGFFLPLAGITTVAQIRESAFDIKATGRLNKLYVELQQDNPDWASRPHDMNHFMARLIFCFFAEDTDIFLGDGLFSKTVEQMSARDASDTHLVIGEIFRAMDTAIARRDAAGIKRYANQFPYVNGQLFAGSTAAPRFSRIARSYLLHIGSLNWRKINPDIFGSMIQAVADDEERGALGMHYTSVPNILKVLNPLFLDDLRAKLAEAGDNARKLSNLRGRMAKIRVFDPACGSGNFLVIAYKEMRAIEAEINRRRGEPDRRTDIPLTNCRGIELRDFPAEIARLALIIAEYQSDVLYRGQQEALAEFLPLDSQNWITCGNALRLDWLSICPPTGIGVKMRGDDLFQTPLDQAEIDFANEGGETYICGNPPFSGARKQTSDQKSDLETVFSASTRNWKNSDFVAAWFWKAAKFNDVCPAPFAFVATNSICQGQQVPIIWRLLGDAGLHIRFAHTSFKWNNLASHNAGVTVVIVGLDSFCGGKRLLFDDNLQKEVVEISPYLTSSQVEIVDARKSPLSQITPMDYGVYYSKSEGLMLDRSERDGLLAAGVPPDLMRQFWGTSEFLYGKSRYCLWIDDNEVVSALQHSGIAKRVSEVRKSRLGTSDKAVNKLAEKSYMFRERKGDKGRKAFIPIVCSESREWFPVGVADEDPIPTSRAFFISDPALHELAILLSRLHLVWIGTVCGKFELRFVYSNTLGWNTFPVPTLTDQNRTDLTRCAEDILLAREAHFPATIADLYDPQDMPTDLRAAHERNDEVLERIYIGRRFRNDTERLEKLFELYTRMTGAKAAQREAGRDFSNCGVALNGC